MKKIIAFDLGRVLFDFDYSLALNRLQTRVKVTAAELIEEILSSDFSLGFEKGLVSASEFYRDFQKRFGSNIGYEEFLDIWSDIFTPKEEMIGLAERLGRVYPLYLISNICEPHFQFLFARYPHVFGLFRTHILSYRVKSVKPEQEIYSRLKDAGKARYADIVYIDDREELVSAARGYGIDAVVFRGSEPLERELAMRGVWVPDIDEAQVLGEIARFLDDRPKVMIAGDPLPGTEFLKGTFTDPEGYAQKTEGAAVICYQRKRKEGGAPECVLRAVRVGPGEENLWRDIFRRHPVFSDFLQKKITFDILLLTSVQKGEEKSQGTAAAGIRGEELLRRFFRTRAGVIPENAETGEKS
ncbi:MAG: hypothetical protein GF333_00865 [Candidatus Omnitrophica bacterium]|nr:hypothetical protein [Candidatus Omnitrophota bacterium]